MVVLFVNTLMQNTMAEQNVPAQAPTRTDEQILPRSAWLQIRKSNLLFDAQKIQKNPIFQISVDILRNTNFFRAFSASASIPAIYIQQFWNTMKYDEKTGVYCCQVDEQWFNLSVDLLRKALETTPVDLAHPFELPLTGDMVIDFVNQLSDKPRHPVLQMLWGIVTKTSIDHAELLWEEFTQGIHTFFSHKASHKASLKDPKKKAVPLLIPYGRFTKMIIYYVGSTSNVHRRPESPRHLPRDDFLLGNLKFIPKGETDEVRAPPKKPTPVKPTKPAPVKQTKPPSSKLPKSPKMKPSKITPSRKVRKGKPSLIDEEDEAQQEPEPQGEGDDPALELAKKLSLDAHQEKGEGEGADTDLERAIKLSLAPFFLPQRQAPVGGVAIRERVAKEIQRLPDVEGKAIVIEEQAAHSLIDLSKKKSTTDQFILQRRDHVPYDSTTGPPSQPQDNTSEKVAGSDLGQGYEALAGSNLEPMQEDSGPGKEHVTLAGPNPEHMDEDFYSTSYPKEKTNFVTSAPPVTAQVINISSPLVIAPPINTEATTIITTLLEITPFIALQLRVMKLEQDMSEVKKSDHSAAALERYTADLVEKYSVLPAPASSKKQESEKSPKQIIIIKREQGEKKPEPKYTIKLTHKAALELFDLKGALFNIMHKNKSANRNPANYRLYHVLMEALIEDENAMDKEVAYKVKDHKKSAIVMMMKTMMMKALQLDQTRPPAHTSSAWQITDTRDTPPDPSMQRSNHQFEQSSYDNPITDEGHVSDPEDTNNAHIPKVSSATWFKPIPEEERPATPKPEWTIPSNDYPKPKNNWANI
ncbi:hypothetical protein Tco_1419885 [Tanacetum coccineum]